eukprot:PITA_02193
MEDRAFRKSQEMPSKEQSKDDLLVQLLRPAETSTSISPKGKTPKVEPQEEEEQTDIPTTSDAMVEEYNSIMVNDVWEVVPRPQDRSVIGSRWLYKVKHTADGSVEKYKAMVVAKGFVQKEGIDYEETFAPIAKYTSIRSVISLASQMG